MTLQDIVQIKNRILQDPVQKKALLALGALIILGFVFSKNETKTTTAQSPSEDSQFTPDTIIPDGYVLVPIQLQNFASLDSMIGQYGVVDLFTAHEDPSQKSRKVGNRLKLIRAPLNPSQFAVLVPDSEADLILSHTGFYNAVIQNPQQKLKEKLNRLEARPQKISIDYQN